MNFSRALQRRARIRTALRRSRVGAVDWNDKFIRLLYTFLTDAAEHIEGNFKLVPTGKFKDLAACLIVPLCKPFWFTMPNIFEK